MLYTQSLLEDTVRKSTRNSWAYLTLFLVLALLAGLPTAQSQQAPALVPALVIEGGTLIDGNGGTPVRDSEVVIQGNKITSVSRKGQAPYPANAWIIKAEGK